MPNVPIRYRREFANTIANCEDIEDLHIIDIGATAIKLSEIPSQDPDGIGQFGPDFFIYDGTSTYFQIRTAASGGGTLLSVGVVGDGSTSDIYVGDKDNYLSSQLGIDVYSTITMSNASYQSGSLWLTCKSPGDLANPQDINNVTNIILEVDADYEVSELCGNITLFVTTGATDKIIKLPSLKNRNADITIIKADDGVGNIDITDNNDVTIFQLWAGKGDHVTFKCGPSSWMNMTPKSWKLVRDPILSIGREWYFVLGTFSTTNNFANTFNVTCYDGTVLYGVNYLDWKNACPVGSKAIKVKYNSSGTTVYQFYRADGDTNIRNNPGTTPQEFSAIYYNAAGYMLEVEMKLSSQYRTQHTVNNTNNVAYLSSPFAYYQ